MNNKKLIISLIVVFIFSITVVNAFGAEKNVVPKKVLKLEKKGDKALKKKDYDKALEYFKQANEIYPEYDKVHYKIASIYAFQKNYNEAIKELKTALKLNKDDVKIKKAYAETLIRAGQKLMKEKKLKEANALFIDIVNIPGYSEVEPKLINEMLYRIGFNYFSLKELKNANEYLLKFVNSSTSKTDFPKFYSMATYLIGINYSQLNDTDSANKYLESYIELNKENPEDRYVPFAKYIIGTNKFKVLEEKVNEIRKGSNKKNLKKIKQKIVKLATDSKGIEDNLLFSIEKNPKLEGAFVMLGNFYYLKNDLTNSMKYYNLLIEKFPGSSDIEIYKVFLKDLKRQKKEK
ncbi:MAG: tetratricopeptide repeat protein [Acidobacteriota bacterium]